MEYKIGSFNMKRFGMGTKKDLDKIAEIILGENLDVVALQEIYSEGKGVERLLEQFVKYQIYNWEYRYEKPSETSDYCKNVDMIQKDTRGEGYAYLWNKSKFKCMGFSQNGKKRIFEPRIINSKSRDVNVDCSFFARVPYYIRLQPIYGGFFEIRLINIHIYYGDNSLSSIDKRKKEFELLTQEIYPDISTNRYGQFRVAYTIALGDYNLNIFSPNIQTEKKNCYLSKVYTYEDGKESVQVLTVQEQLTTLKVKEDGYANNFDHFTYSPELSNFNSVSYETIDVVNKYCGGDLAYYRENISDHLPIVMKVQI